MANNYLKLSFVLTPTSEEEALLDECHTLSQELYDVDEIDLAARYDEMSDAFKAAFPPPPDQSDNPDQPPPHPFVSFLNLFSDHDFPTFDCEYFCSAEVNGYLIAGTQADPHAIAGLIQKCAPSVLPFGFEWSQDCDRLRPGEFGGGYYIVTADDIIGGSTSWLMQGQVEALKTPPITHTNSATLKTVVTDPQALWDQPHTSSTTGVRAGGSTFPSPSAKRPMAGSSRCLAPIRTHSGAFPLIFSRSCVSPARADVSIFCSTATEPPLTG